MSIHSPLPASDLALSPWQASTLDALASVKRMQADLAAIRRDLALRPHEMTGPTMLKLAAAENAIEDMQTELMKVFQTI